MSMDKPIEPFGECSLPAALTAMGERWSFMILRSAFNGVRHFEDFQERLGIARNILSDRLGRLVGHEILERRPLSEDRRKIEYRLTRKGRELLPTMIALRQWGERWETGVPSSPVLVDARDRRPIRPVVIQAHDGRTVELGEMAWALPEDIVR